LYAPNEARLAQFAGEAQESLREAEALERAPREDFEAYLAAYLA